VAGHAGVDTTLAVLGLNQGRGTMYQWQMRAGAAMVARSHCFYTTSEADIAIAAAEVGATGQCSCHKYFLSPPVLISRVRICS
jgi:hypothetical protein